MHDLRKLKDEAMQTLRQGNWRKAKLLYGQLEKEEPNEGGWPLKLGEILRKQGNTVEAIRAFSRAVETFSRQKLLLKAIAVCKIILEVDPHHTESHSRLAALHASRAPQPPQAPPPARENPLFTNPASLPAPDVEPQASLLPTFPDPLLSIQTSSAPSPFLRQLHLSALIPGAKQSSELPSLGTEAAMQIPLDLPELWTEEPDPPLAPGPRTLARSIFFKTPFFSVLTEDLLKMAIERVSLRMLAAGETLFSQGDEGDALFIIASGELAVLVPQEVARLGEGDFLGEIALLMGGPRTATVRATLETQVLAIDRALLSDLIAGSPELLALLLRFVRDRLLATFAETSPLFSPFSPLERVALASRFQLLEVPEHARLVEEGTRCPGLFILMSGEAAAVAGRIPVARLEAGDVFGEQSLLSGQGAEATILTLVKSFVLFLPRAAFSEIIMTHPQVLEFMGQLVDSRKPSTGRLKLV